MKVHSLAQVFRFEFPAFRFEFPAFRFEFSAFRFELSALIVVVRQMVDYRISPVELFHEQKTNHLVRECHL